VVENIEKTGKSERYAIVARMPLLLRSQQGVSQPPVPVANQIRIYWWCSPPRIGRRMFAVSTC